MTGDVFLIYAGWDSVSASAAAAHGAEWPELLVHSL